MTTVRILKFEGFVFLVGSFFLYWLLGFNWWMFFLLFFLPDVFMLGYLRGVHIGASVYNIGHSYALPFIFLFYGLFWGAPFPVSIAIIWLAHISADRMLGYGLKLPSGFTKTHLGVIEKKK